jgi:phosphatidate cytidylyltransferase
VSQTTDLGKRVKTAFILIPPFLLILYLGGWFFWALAFFVLSIAFKEYQDLWSRSFPFILRVPFFILLWLILCHWWIKAESSAQFLFFLLLPLVTFIIYPILRSLSLSFRDISSLLLFSLILGLSGLAVIKIREFGFYYAIFFFFTLWITDTTALFVGRFLGRSKFPPYISPNKSLEGFFGGLIIAPLFALLFRVIFTPLFNSVEQHMLGALIISLTGQLGDLAESAIKREAGVKDTSKLLPGHGGLLDRIDSIIGSSLFFMLYLYHAL